jgi:signal transduction histidine kinase
MSTVLAVDDNLDNLYVLERLLRAEGHVVRAASDGPTALAMAAAETPDLIVVDLMMPGMDGFAVLEKLKADPALTHIPVIMLTASDHDPALIARALSMGANDYTYKPVDRVELPARVAAALRLHEAASALRRQSEELAAALVAVDDARRHAEMHATLAQDRTSHLEAMIAGMVEGVFVYDAKGELISINDHGCALLGLESADRDPSSSSHPVLVRLRDAGGDRGDAPLLSRVMRGETVQGIEIEIERRDPSHPATLLCNGAPLRDAAGMVTGAILVVSDISARKELDRAKDEFIGLVAHELKTPLTGLMGHAQLLMRRLRREEGRDADLVHVAAIEEQISRMAALINDLLDVARSQIGRLVVHLRQVNIVSLAREAAEQMQSTTTAHTIMVDAPDSLLWPVDQQKIRQVLVNLLGNAVRYAARGTITVIVAEEERELHITVRDEGVGIPPDALERIFARFEQGGLPQGQGLGLGLYISRGIVQAHGGRIWAESAGVGKGATFHVVLPYQAVSDVSEEETE